MIITEILVSAIDNNIINLEEKKNLVIQLIKTGKLNEILPKLYICLLEILANHTKIRGSTKREINRNTSTRCFSTG